jgi:hypothetical protein
MDTICPASGSVSMPALKKWHYEEGCQGIGVEIIEFVF